MKIGRVALLGAALAISGTASAASSWATHGALGLVMARGATTTESGDLKLDVAHLAGRWTYRGGLAMLYASTNSVTTQQDLNGHLQAQRALSKRTFWFAGLRYDRNLFDGFAFQESLASGLGRILIKSKSTNLSAQLGAGFRREQPELLVTNTLGAVTSRTREAVVGDAVLDAGVEFSHSFSHSTTLKNKLLVQAGSSDTLTSDNLSLQVKMNTELALAVGLRLVNNSNPPPGDARHTDTIMTVNLVYEVKSSKVSADPPTSDLLQSLDMP